MAASYSFVCYFLKIDHKILTWSAVLLSRLTQGAFVLITGRLGAIFGHQRLVLLGSLLFSIFTLANAFCRQYDSFIAVRALTGIGGGMFMPNAVAIITTMVPPGSSRNITLSFFASAPPIGGVLGAVLIGVFIEFLDWPWFFLTLSVSFPTLYQPCFLIFKTLR